MHAAISPSDNGWYWWLYSDRGHGIARAVGYEDDPVDCVKRLSEVLNGDLDDTASNIITSTGVVNLYYDTLCPFGEPQICTPEFGQDICAGCVGAELAGIVSVSG
jgi:hypothetical protein